MTHLIQKLRYMGRQYSAGQINRGGGGEKHYLEEAADELERLQALVGDLRAELRTGEPHVNGYPLHSGLPNDRMRADFTLTLFDDEATRKKRSLLNCLEVMFDDPRNHLPLEYFSFSDHVPFGRQVRVLFELLPENQSQE